MIYPIHYKKNLLFLFIGSLFFIISCKSPVDSKQSYLTEYESFIENIKENNDEYSEEDWNKKDIEFKKFSEELYQKYKSELGFLEQAKIAKYALIYGSTRGVDLFNKVLEDDEIEKSVEEIKKLWDDDLKDEIESVITEIKKVWDDDLKEELEEKLSELKEVLEDEEFQNEISEKVEAIKEIVEDKQLEDEFRDVMREVEKILGRLEEKSRK